MRTQLRSIGCQIADFHEVILPFQNLLIFLRSPGLEKRTVQMNDVFAACPLVEIIYILGNHRNFKRFFQFRNSEVAGVRLSLTRLNSSLVIEIQN